jgi:hypothetical protein
VRRVWGSSGEELRRDPRRIVTIAPGLGVRVIAEQRVKNQVSEVNNAALRAVPAGRRILRPVPSVVPYQQVEHLVRIEATLGTQACRFLVDSGIGLTIVATTTADAVGAKPVDQTFTGRRMSGQEVVVPLVRLPSLDAGGRRFDDHLAGVLDMGDVTGEEGFDGILGLDLFADLCVTVDPVDRTISLMDAAPPEGLVVPVEVERDGPSVAMYTRLELPSGRVVRVEVDTGSGSLILDDSLMADCGITPDSPAVNAQTGTDETGHDYIRRFVTISGSVRVPGLPETTHDRPRVQFQRIMYDGLVGTAFLNRFRHTFDVSGERIVLEPLA